ncbi:MAG: hypothetical protein ACI9CF_001074 [Candidatus Omnitrophota bacterium]|jgi:hypothetical protein
MSEADYQYHIKGAGIAGLVLHHELSRAGFESHIEDRATFPRPKVCGGLLQWDSWDYLNKNFRIDTPHNIISSIRHYQKGKFLQAYQTPQPMVFARRLELDHCLFKQRSVQVKTVKPVREVLATGVSSKQGEWLGFHVKGDAINGLEMHYGDRLYAGVAQNTVNESHIAFLIHHSCFKSIEALPELLKSQLGLKVMGSIKGTRRIHYGMQHPDWAIGDAKMTTHPFLGLGMKHAIESARLLADLIMANRYADYALEHRRKFKAYFWTSQLLGRAFDSPLQNLVWSVFSNPALMNNAYHLIH